jgi:hypothetical protein
MSQEHVLAAPQVIIPCETLTAPVEVLPLLGNSQEVPGPEQIRAVEAVFTQDQADRERHLVSGLLGLWTGTVLLHDLAVEHLSRPTPENLPRARPREYEPGQDN